MSAGDDGRICAACRYWQETRGDAGECRKLPPTVHLVPGTSIASQGLSLRTLAVFPPTAATGWCGAFVADGGEEDTMPPFMVTR